MTVAAVQRLPILPLPHGLVLLPGTTVRIPVQNRPDVRALFSAASTRLKRPRFKLEGFLLGCVPLKSPFLNSEGQKLITQNEEGKLGESDENTVIDPAGARRRDLFTYGTSAKVRRAYGVSREEAVLEVEGVRRFKLDRITQKKPFYEAEVHFVDDEGNLTWYHPSIKPANNSRAEVDPGDLEIHSLFDQLKRTSSELLSIMRLASLVPGSRSSVDPVTARQLSRFIEAKELDEAGLLADAMSSVANASLEDKLAILAGTNVKERLEKVVGLLSDLVQNMKGKVKILSVSRSRPALRGLNIDRIGQQDRDNIMRRILSGFGPSSPASRSSNFGGMPPSLGGPSGEEPDELEELKKRLADARLPPEADKIAERELSRLRKMNPAQAEYGVCRTYLETMVELPWSKSTEDHLDANTLRRARKQFDDDHYGLEKVKKRLLEYLAVLRLKQRLNKGIEQEIQTAAEKAAALKEVNTDISLAEADVEIARIANLKGRRSTDKSPILLLVGPPGTGKTSLAKSVATSLGRKFHRISLGGVRDEAEIRGHRRTYVAAMPGLIVSGLKKAGVNNPVFLLDEVDKVGHVSNHGDPSAAMLEVLDPEQNHTFSDHYLNTPFDLSKVLFIATANYIENISPPLLDRMETISLSGYTTHEKRHIATRHLIPKQTLANALSPSQIIFPMDTIDEIITSYTREPGVRNLEREIGSVCRFKAVQFSEAQDSAPQPIIKSTSLPMTYEPSVTSSNLTTILGPRKFDLELAAQSSTPGIVTGLVAFSGGAQGSILFIEVASMPASASSTTLQLTGTLGSVLKESVEVALSWVKSHAHDLGISTSPRENIMDGRSIHVHCPAGATPKDGPSAGLAFSVALISLFLERPVPPIVAMTGEVSLRGKVMPVGGIREKLIGAHRAGVKAVLLPERNERDTGEVPDEVKEDVKIVTVRNVWEALAVIWPGREERWAESGGEGRKDASSHWAESRL